MLHTQHNKPMRTRQRARTRQKARGNESNQVTGGICFESDWWRRWREFS